MTSLFLVWPLIAAAPAGEMPEDDCLGCHADREISKSLEDGDVRSLFVDPWEWGQSPHAAEGCRACHGDVDTDRHPDEQSPAGAIRPALSLLGKCRPCHGREDEYIPVHEVMANQPEAPACSQCHAPHRMKRVREWKPGVSGSMYCLTCHQKMMRVSLASGETVPLTIRDAALGTSVHLDHQCTDCHEGFSKLEHPLRKPASLEDLKSAGYARCRGCHAEQYEVFEGSLHFKMAKHGHPDAPLCTDCHGYHAVAPLTNFELLAGLPCRRCHADVFQDFAKGVHRSRPRAASHTELPACVTCHRAHESAFTPVKSLINDVCLQCHEEAEAAHGKWLPKAIVHLEAVACTACHAPAAKRDFVVRIVDTDSGEYVRLSALQGSDNPELSSILSGTGEDRRDLAFWGDVVSALGKEHDRRFHLRMELQEGGAAHEIGEWEVAHRKCDSCHEDDLRHLQRVFRPPTR